MGFRAFRVLGCRALGFRVSGFRVLGFQDSRPLFVGTWVPLTCDLCGWVAWKT